MKITHSILWLIINILLLGFFLSTLYGQCVYKLEHLTLKRLSGGVPQTAVYCGYGCPVNFVVELWTNLLRSHHSDGRAHVAPGTPKSCADTGAPSVVNFLCKCAIPLRRVYQCTVLFVWKFHGILWRDPNGESSANSTNVASEFLHVRQMRQIVHGDWDWNVAHSDRPPGVPKSSRQVYGQLPYNSQGRLDLKYGRSSMNVPQHPVQWWVDGAYVVLQTCWHVQLWKWHGAMARA
jgi:hypothetical protein